MARYNRYNHQIKFNHKSTSEGGIFNYRIFGIAGSVISALTVTAIPHLKRSAISIISVSLTTASTAKRTFRRTASTVISTALTGVAIRKRNSKSIVNISSLIVGTAKRNLFVKATSNIVLGFIAILRQKYRPVYPNLEVIEYPIETLVIDYPISMNLTEYELLLEVSGLATAGSTITLKGTFPDSAGELTQLESVALKVYAPGKVLVNTITPTQVSAGIYTANYTIPADTMGQFDYEFSGILGDKTILGRSSFDSHWR